MSPTSVSTCALIVAACLWFVSGAGVRIDKGGAASDRYSFVNALFWNNAPELDFADPLFGDAQAGDFHLKSTFGRWTPDGYEEDDVSSPAFGMGDPAADASGHPDRAGERIELGAYGNSPEAALVR